MEATAYTAACYRSGRWWAIVFPQLPGVATRARSLDQVDWMARRAIGRARGVPAEAIWVEVHLELPGPMQQALQAHHMAIQAEEPDASANAAAANALLQAGCIDRDVEILLGSA